MKVLVTGHNGYIGSILVSKVVAAGNDVFGLDSYFFGDCTFGYPTEDIPALKKDIRDILPADLVGVDAVIHLAALSNDPLANLNPDLTYEINYLAPVHLAQLTKEVGIKRYIFASSCSVYGFTSEDMVKEEGPLNPLTPYSVSKLRAEEAIAKLADSNFSPTFLRNATAYGVSSHMRFDLLLNDLVAWAFTTGRLYLGRNVKLWRPLVHVEDIADAFIAVLNAPREMVHNQVFNVGRNEENYHIQELAELIIQTLPIPCQIEFTEKVSDKRSYWVDCSKIGQLLPEFRPSWNVQSGIRALYESFCAANLTFEKFQEPKYKRVEHIKHLLANKSLDSTLRWIIE